MIVINPSRVPIDFDFATPEDDAELRRLLRDNAMPGSISVTMQREPNFFLSTTIEGDEHDTVVGKTRDPSRLIGLGSRSVRNAFVNGRVVRLGYLSQVRVEPAFREQRRVLYGGFSKLLEKHKTGDASYYHTTIIEDNHVARRTLASGLPGLPAYREREVFSTLLIPVWRKRRIPRSRRFAIRHAVAGDMPEVARWLQQQYAQFQFAPQWTAEDLLDASRTRGLSPEDFVIACSGAQIRGCIAVWNQQSFKQTVVMGYAGNLRRFRSLINVVAPLARLPHLPRPGQVFSHAYLSHLAFDPNEPDVLLQLVSSACNLAKDRGHANVSIGLAARHPLYKTLKAHFRHIEYRAILYSVHWKDDATPVEQLDDRIPHVEIATL